MKFLVKIREIDLKKKTNWEVYEMEQFNCQEASY